MHIPNAEKFMAHFRQTVEELTSETETMAAFHRSNLVIRVHFEDIATQIAFDGRMGEVFWTATPGRADLELSLTTRLFHDVMMGTRSLRESIMDGSIRIKGNILRALSFAELLQAAKPLYRTQWEVASRDG